MPNVYLGTTAITKAELGTTDVTKVYLGSNLIWPSFTPVTIFDTFEAESVPLYVKTGAELSMDGSVGIAGGFPSAGERTLRRTGAPSELAGDDVYIKAVMGTNGNQNTSIVFRLNDTYDRYVALNMINGTSYLQRIKPDGSWTDINTGGTSLTTTAGVTIEILATAADNRYKVWRNGSLVINVVDPTPANKGPGYRGVGLRFTRTGFSNSPRINEMTWADYTNQI